MWCHVQVGGINVMSYNVWLMHIAFCYNHLLNPKPFCIAGHLTLRITRGRLKLFNLKALWLHGNPPYPSSTNFISTSLSKVQVDPYHTLYVCVLMASTVCVLMANTVCVLMANTVCVLMANTVCVLMASTVCVLMASTVCVLMASTVCVLMSYTVCVRWIFSSICKQTREDERHNLVSYKNNFSLFKKNTSTSPWKVTFIPAFFQSLTASNQTLHGPSLTHSSLLSLQMQNCLHSCHQYRASCHKRDY